MNLIGTNKPIRATKARLDANDCPPKCNKTHCDECPFRSNSKRKIRTKIGLAV